MKTILLLLTLLIALFCYSQQNDNETITITGRVTDFEGHPIDSAAVQLKHADFSQAYITYSDSNGYYRLENVKKGKYLAMYVLRLKEYPRNNAVPKEDMRLEYWAWNVIADKDLVINPRYHRLELYGTKVFRIEGAYPGLMVYVRPMSLGKLLTYPEEVYTNKSKIDQYTDISVKPENFQVKIYANEKPLHINSIQAIQEYSGENQAPLIGYLMHVEIKERPTQTLIFRIEATNLELNEKGENLFFYELQNYQ